MSLMLEKLDEALAALSVDDRLRLERLAVLARISPEDIWPEVWQYGFEDVEDSVQAELEAYEDVKAGRTVPHEEVMAKALLILEANAQNKRKTS
jgi:predicted transcriptional regulator